LAKLKLGCFDDNPKKNYEKELLGGGISLAQCSSVVRNVE